MSTRPGIRIVSITASLALGALLGCGGGGGSSAPAAAAAPAVSVSVAPEQALQTTLRPQTFKATVTGTDNTAVTWSVVSGGGSIDARTGVYVAPDHPGTVVVKAQSAADPARSATAAVTVVPAPTISGFTTNKAIIPFGGSATLTPTFTTDGTAVVTPSLGGAVASGAGYPVSPTAITSYTLTVTNSAGTSVAATVTVDVLTAQVSVAPASATVTAGATQQFNAAVGGAVNTGVSWTATAGSVSPTGLYTAPATPGTYAVVASSAADPSKSVLASVKVVAAPAIASFTAAKATLSKGNGTVLSYAFSGGTGVVDQGVGAVISGGTANVAPDDTTKYTLAVTNEAGTTVTRQVPVTVVAPPDGTLTLATAASLPSRSAGFKASVPAQAGCTYAWALPAAQGTITAGAGTNAVTFSTADGGQSLNLQCTVTNAAGDAAVGSASVPVRRRWMPLTPVPGVGAGLQAAVDSALDDNGTQWYLFVQLTSAGSPGGPWGLYAVRYAGGAWSAPARLDTTSSQSSSGFFHPHLATDNKGHAVAVWGQYDATQVGNQLMASRFDGSAWGAPVRLDNLTVTGASTSYAALTMDASGRTLAVWMQNPGDGRPRLFSAYHDGNSWGAPIQVDSTGTTTTRYLSSDTPPAVVSDPTGMCMIAWAIADATADTYTCQFKAFYPGLGWGPVRDLSAGIPRSAGIPPVLLTAGDRQGHGMVAFMDYRSGNLTLSTRRFPLISGFYEGLNQVVATASGTSNCPLPSSLSLAAGGKGVIGYTVPGTLPQAYAAEQDPTLDTWGYPQFLGDGRVGQHDPALAMSAAGAVVGAWIADGSEYMLEGSAWAPDAGWEGSVALNPNLGFLASGPSMKVYPSGMGLVVVLMQDGSGYHLYSGYYR